jgi:hypothetical protein
MPIELFEDAYGDPRNAAALIAVCHYTYWPADRGVAAFKEHFGLDAKLISVDNTQAYVASNDDHLVVSFRGSEDPTSIDGLNDWLLTNALNLLVLPEGRLGTDLSAAGVGARFHSGFVAAIGEVWDPLYAEVDARLKQRDRPLWITGHSLGGALALLAAWLFLRRTISPHQVYTFGAPMIGNADAAKAFDREFAGKIFRYVNTPDPVPLLPMMSLVSNDYSHCEKVVNLGDTAAAANLFAYLRSSAGEAVAGLLAGDAAERVWGGIKAKLIAHLLPDYQGLIK